MSKDYDLIDMAEQQLLGFKYAQQGTSLLGLVESMGLGEDELNDLIKRYPATLTDDEVKEIREFINE